MVPDFLLVMRDSLSAWVDWAYLSVARQRVLPMSATALHRLALMTWAMPPSTNAGVYRPLSFVRYAPSDRWAVSAVHADGPQTSSKAGLELDAQWPAEVTRIRIKPSERKPSWRLFPQVDGGFATALELAKGAIGGLRANPPEVVLASGPPFCMFIAGAMVADHFGAKLVLDYRDEWSECPFDFVSHGRDDRQWERACLKRADAVIFTTESHRLHQIATFPVLKPANTHLIPNGWDSFIGARQTVPSDNQEPDGATLVISHIGNVATHTPPDGLLSLVGRLVENYPVWRSRLRLSFVGGRSQAAQVKLDAFPYQDMLELVDHIPKSEADRRMREADILLLIAVEQLERYIPGKLFEYVAARRPILLAGHPGEASRIIERLGVGSLVNPLDTAENFAGALQALADLRRSMPSSVSGWLAEHRRSHLASQLYGVLDGLIGRFDEPPPKTVSAGAPYL